MDYKDVLMDYKCKSADGARYRGLQVASARVQGMMDYKWCKVDVCKKNLLLPAR